MAGRSAQHKLTVLANLTVPAAMLPFEGMSASEPLGMFLPFLTNSAHFSDTDLQFRVQNLNSMLLYSFVFNLHFTWDYNKSF